MPDLLRDGPRYLRRAGLEDHRCRGAGQAGHARAGRPRSRPPPTCCATPRPPPPDGPAARRGLQPAVRQLRAQRPPAGDARPLRRAERTAVPRSVAGWHAGGPGAPGSLPGSLARDGARQCGAGTALPARADRARTADRLPALCPARHPADGRGRRGHPLSAASPGQRARPTRPRLLAVRRHAPGTAALHGRRPAVGSDAQHRAGRGRAVPGLARSGRRARHAVRRLPGPRPEPRVPRQRRLSGPYRASEEFGARLRRLREAAGLNGKQLATALSWPHSKISKIELARQRPTADEVTAWAHATGAVGDLEALLADLRSLRVESASWRR